MSGIRVGQGFDVHAFQQGGRLMLGGVQVPHTHSLAAHSDGDVVLHAICDALLGAAALGDIGRHFPDTDPQFSGADSRELLRAVMDKVGGDGWKVGNLDVTIIAQAPRMSPHIEAMRSAIAEDLGVAIGAVNVKATTTEHLGFCGRKEGIATFAVVLLEAG